MSDEILKVIERWQSDERLASFDEARVKQAIILPILRGLGWDTDNPDEVWPEYSVKERWVDYALLTGPQQRYSSKQKREENHWKDTIVNFWITPVNMIVLK